MNFTANIKHGPLDIEIQSDDQEEVQEAVMEFVRFLDNNEELFEGLNYTPRPTPNTPVDGGSVVSQTPEPREPGPQVTSREGHFSDIAERIGVDEATLDELFELPDDKDEPPFLKLYQFEEGPEVLGSSRKDRQARGSLILLYLWKECRGVEEVESAELNNGLSYSDISPERRDAMYSALEGAADNYFDRGGVISLTVRGEHAAHEEIKDLMEQYEL